MLESFKTDKFNYKRLTLEEQKNRGILGRLVGVIADTTGATRNGRKYTESLWDKTFENPIIKEKLANKCLWPPIDNAVTSYYNYIEVTCYCLTWR